MLIYKYCALKNIKSFSKTVEGKLSLKKNGSQNQERVQLSLHTLVSFNWIEMQDFSLKYGQECRRGSNVESMFGNRSH